MIRIFCVKILNFHVSRFKVNKYDFPWLLGFNLVLNRQDFKQGLNLQLFFGFLLIKSPLFPSFFHPVFPL